MDISEAKRLKTLEAENARLKRIVAQQAMDMEALKELLSKKMENGFVHLQLLPSDCSTRLIPNKTCPKGKNLL